MEDPTPTNTPPNNDEETGNTKSIEFPLTHYYELEARVHTDQWSIPYKREESLAICMLSTIRMMKEGIYNVCVIMWLYVPDCSDCMYMCIYVHVFKYMYVHAYMICVYMYIAGV